MNKKFLIVLFVTIFYNGVTYSSPVKETTSDLISKEKSVSAAAVTDHGNEKVESSSLAPQNVSHIESPTSSNSSIHLDGNGKAVPGNETGVVVDKKTANQTSSLRNDTLNAGIIKNENSTVPLNTTNSTANATSNATNSNVTPKPETISTRDLTPEKITEMPRPLPAGQSMTSSTTPGTVKTTEAPVTKTTIKATTVAVSTSTESTLKEHDTSSKSEQKGFDGASFVGGIVLTIGLTAIGFIAFKYYKSGKIDGNYRTL